jgi:hypothetical protein
MQFPERLPAPLMADCLGRVGGMAVAAAMTGLVLYVMLARFAYPYELEWMTGAILDHVERVRLGQPLYAPPSGEWMPFIYTPGYYWVSALVSRVVPSLATAQACRGVSLASAFAAAGCAWGLARRAGADRYFAALAPLLFFGCFGLTCQWYDVERSDTLFVALVALGALATQSARPAAWVAGGAVVGLAFFVKQPATTFVVLVPVVLALAGRVRRAVAFGGGAVVGLAPLYFVLQAKTDGWFAFYCLTVPSAHGIAARYLTTFFIVDLAKGAVLTIATIGAVADLVGVVRTRRGRGVTEGADAWVVLAAFLVAGFVASALSRMHVGGWPNVLLFWTTFAAPAVAVLATRIDAGVAATPGARAALALAVAFQTAVLVPDPNESIPGADSLRYDAAVAARVHEIEASAGDVVLTGRGHVTTKRHPHINALVDVLRAGKPLPDDMRAAIANRAWGAIVLNDIADIRLTELLDHESELFELVTRRYFVAERFDDKDPLPVVGFPTLPRWILRPRRAPLVEASHDELMRRQRIEMGLAERNMRAAQVTPGLRLDGLEIEDEAARTASEARAVN